MEVFCVHNVIRNLRHCMVRYQYVFGLPGRVCSLENCLAIICSTTVEQFQIFNILLSSEKELSCLLTSMVRMWHISWDYCFSFRGSLLTPLRRSEFLIGLNVSTSFVLGFVRRLSLFIIVYRGWQNFCTCTPMCVKALCTFSSTDSCGKNQDRVSGKALSIQYLHTCVCG